MKKRYLSADLKKMREWAMHSSKGSHFQVERIARNKAEGDKNRAIWVTPRSVWLEWLKPGGGVGEDDEDFEAQWGLWIHSQWGRVGSQPLSLQQESHLQVIILSCPIAHLLPTVETEVNYPVPTLCLPRPHQMWYPWISCLRTLPRAWFLFSRGLKKPDY